MCSHEEARLESWNSSCVETLWERLQRESALNHVCNQTNERTRRHRRSALCVACLGAEHAASALEGGDCPHCDVLPLRLLRSRKALFSVEGAFTSVPRGSGPASAEAERRLHSWGSQLDLVEGMETGDPLSPASPTRSAARPLGSEARAAVSSPRGSASTLPISSSEEVGVVIVDEAAAPQFSQYEELLEVVTRRCCPGAVTEQPRPSTSSSRREAQKQSVATRTPPHRERVVKRSRSRTSQAKPDLRVPSVPSGDRSANPAGASGRSGLQRDLFPPGNVAGLGSSPPPRGSLGPLVQVLPAGQPFQDTVPAAHITPEASLERLVPLVDHLAAWKLLPNVSAWVLHTVERGYRIQFGAQPPQFNGVSPTLVGLEQGLVMEQEVATLLRKEAIEVVPPHARESGIYSRYLIVPKKDGGLRPILDLCLLNRSVKRLKFKMLTIKQVVSQIRSEDWFVTIDLKDAYFHVSILPQHRKFLRFAFRGEAYQYRVLPFGLALSPHTFTKCVNAALAPLRLQGIRILNYIDDWLILAQSEMVAVRHRDVVLAHMKALGLRLNAKKKDHLSGRGVGFDHDAGTFVSCSDRVDPHCSQESEGRLVTHCEAVPATAGSDGSSVQRDTFWPAVHETPTVVAQDQGVLPEGKPILHDQGHAALPTCPGHVEETLVLVSGPGAGSSLSPRNASDGRVPHRLGSGHEWPPCLRSVERSPTHVAHKLPGDAGRVSSSETLSPGPKRPPCVGPHNNTAVVSYINHQGGLCSRPLYKLAHQILVWSQDKLLSLRAVYVAGRLNLGADILSRQGPRPGEWMLHPEVMKQIWRVFGPAQVDLFATRENTQCPFWCSLVHPAPLGLDAMVQTWPSSRESAPGRSFPSSSSPVLAGPSMVLGPDFSPRAHLLASGLSTKVVETILHSRAPSTRKLYALKWKLFTSWCGRRQQDPVNCPVSAGPAVFRVYVAAIAAYHAPLGGLSVGKDPLVTRFLRGALRLRPPRVGDLQALSVAPSFLDFAPGLSKAFLYPRPGYVPKVPSSTPRLVVLQAFCPPPFRDSDQQKLNCMCPVRALDAYVHRAARWRKSDQLFVCYSPPKRGLPTSKQTLSRWIVDAICSAYEASDLPPPLGVRAHSTRSMAASKAFLAGHILGRSGGVGISFPKRFDAVRFPEGERLRERDAASRSHPPASLRALLLSWKLTLVLAHVLLCFLVSDVTRL
ncbi:Transposon Ty3-G Gag-Pol polyprotein [Labeo rohita]|uniref:ribonuclease H n=1 Tax=Labeo rohita TaxID=84645 RepID=A0ABQ8L0K5_LABRO|nr:Transposon Ty3-G Gag-Pol polyprotein [Labeo rohita]